MTTRILTDPTDRAYTDGTSRSDALVARALALFAIADANGHVTVRTVLAFDDALDGIDEVNDMLSEQITGSTVGLTDISWKPVDVTDSGGVVLEVSASIETLRDEPEVADALDEPDKAVAPEDISAIPEPKPTGYVIVNSSGGVFQSHETFGDSKVETILIDWDEINETTEDVAAEYAQDILETLESFPEKARTQYRNEIKQAFNRQGYTFPPAQDA